MIEFEEEAANHTSTTAFVARRVPLQWPQVFKAWTLALLGVLFLLWLVVNRAR